MNCKSHLTSYDQEPHAQSFSLKNKENKQDTVESVCEP